MQRCLELKKVLWKSCRRIFSNKGQRLFLLKSSQNFLICWWLSEKIITYKKRVYAMKIAVVFDSAGTLLRMYRVAKNIDTVSYTHLRAHETRHELVCRLLLEKK